MNTASPSGAETEFMDSGLRRNDEEGPPVPFPLLRPASGWATLPCGTGGDMRHYRVNKLAKVGGEIVKRKDILAADDREAVARVQSDVDCPICDVWRDGEKVGSIT